MNPTRRAACVDGSTRARSWPTGRAMVSCRGRDRARGGRRGVLAAPAVAVRGRRRPGSVPQIRREARIVQPPAVEPGGELAESRGVDAARVRRGGPRDELGRGLGAVRGRERAGCAAAGGHVLHDRWNYRVGSPFCPMPPASPLTPRHVP